MDNLHEHSHELENTLPRLLERLREIPDIEWDESIPPIHSSYDDWIVFGVRTLSQSGSRKSTPASSINLSPSFTPGSPGYERSPSLSYVSAEEGQAQAIRQKIAARVTRHVLRLEREYQLSETLLSESDPNYRHHIHPLQALRLRPRLPGEVPLLVAIVVAAGPNHLRDLISFGPNFYSASDVPNRRDSESTATETGPTPKPQEISLNEFLMFAIGATECLEMLHQGNRIVHGEIRGDAFHWNLATGAIKLTNFGSGVRSFEHGLTSAGWSTLSREHGAAYKLQFIAPEQTGRLPAAPDSRTDIYSLGVLFWVMLMGDKPFHGDTPLQIMQNVLGRRIPSVASKRLDVPEALSAVIQKMVQKNIEDRYHSANGLKYDLCQIQLMLAEGDCVALENFEIASKDVNCFFNLPNMQVGRDSEYERVVSIIHKVAERQNKNNPSPKSYHVHSSNSSHSEGRADISTQAEDTASQATSKDSKASPSSFVPLTAVRTHDSRDSIPEGLGRSYQNGSWHGNNLDSRLSLDNTTSTGSDFGTQTGSASSFSDNAGFILRNNQKYKRKGKTEVITISGVTGLGKSCLIHSIQGDARRYGYFASSKFDQMKKTPFESMLKVMSSLFRQIFSETNVSTEFHNNLRSFVRPVWPFLHKLLDLPSWLLGIGPNRSAPTGKTHNFEQEKDDEQEATKNHKTKNGIMCGAKGHTAADFLSSGSSAKSSRFMAIFLDILRFLSSNKLILFCVDDLQFADDESLAVLQSILLAKIPMVLIATYREKHLLPIKVQLLLDSNAADVTAIDLSPLTEDYVADYVAATLQRSTDYVFPLVAVIQEKTRGNPFFMKEMLDTCYREHCIWFSWADSSWMYDLDKVFSLFESQEYGSSINNSFVVKRLQGLGVNTRLFIAWASLLGSTFSFKMVKALMNKSSGLRHNSDFHGKVHLLRQSSRDAIQGLHGAIAAYIIMPGESDDQFRFCHDRYVQAASSLEERRDDTEMHFHIAEAMMSHHDGNQSSVYVKSAHICAAIDLIKKHIPFRSVYRDVLFRAAEETAESGGRTTAVTYFANAIGLLQPDPWDDSKPDVNYQETLALFTRGADCYWAQGIEEPALSLLNITLEKARDASDKAASWILQARVHGRRGNIRLAFKTLTDCLADLGQEIPDTSWEECDKRFHELRKEILHADKQALLDRPLTSCRLYKAIGAVLCELMGGAYWANPLLYYKICLVEVDLNLHRGNVTQAGLAYVHLATVAIGRFNMMQFGVDMGHFADQYFTKFSYDQYVVGRGRAAHSMLVGHISVHIKNTLPFLEAAMETSLSAGDRHSSLLAVSFVASIRIWASHDLVDVESFCTYAAEELIDWQKDVRGGILIIAIRQFCKALQGKTFAESANSVFSDEEHTQEEYLTYVEKHAINPKRGRGSYETYLIVALYLYGHIEEAIEVGEKCLELSEQMWSARHRPSNEFYLSLAYATLIRENPNRADRVELLGRIEKYRDNIIAWSAVTDVNYCAWSSLLTSELADLTGNYGEAVRWCETALDHAEVHGFMFEQALGYELYAEHAIHRGAKRPAKSSLMEAISAYRKISAFGKARHLSEKYEWLLHGTSCLVSVDAGCQTIDMVDHHSPRSHHDEINHDTGLHPNHLAPVRTNEDLHEHGLEAFGLDMIDLTSILRSSHILSSELQIDRLLHKMTSIIVQSTGAELCAIVSEDDQIGWSVAAVMDAEDSDREYPIGQSLDCVEDLVGKQVTLYCLRFKETVFLHNVLLDDRFSNVPDSYLKTYPEGQAIIACPILHGDDMILGCVYIQGPPHCFTERNMTVLRLLVNSISISITNAKLFTKVEKVSASNLVMIESQKQALAQARRAEAAAKTAEAEAIRNMKLKEEAAKAKTMFLANISHELRTPLNGVIGMSELLKDSKLDTDQKEYANSIHVCADTLLTLINDILDFSKLEAGKMQIFSVPLRLTETIAEVVRALSYANKEKDLETIMKLDIINEPLVMGDPVRLHQILMNLLSNSYKFTSHGSVTVKATVDREDSRSITMTCSVIDTGLGITDEQKKKLFLPFSQADSSTARSFGGTGLGLSICKAIIENVMKGKIWLESQPGVGTNVSFSLNFQKAPSDESAPTEDHHYSRDPMAIFTPPPDASSSPPSLPAVDITSVPRDKLRICIAEDNPINQKIAITYVKKLGFQCEAFGDGRQAVTALERASAAGNPFHIVLMDVQMPVLDGYNATREIRVHMDKAVREVLVIAMTASAIRGDREKCIEAGMNNYLAKPVRAAVLKQMLESYWIPGSTPPRAAEDSEAPAKAATPADAVNGEKKKSSDVAAADGEVRDAH